MKQLICEMCASTDIVKQNGYFVCTFCGCKYTVEEAKKMMVEGTVRIDKTTETENHISNARRAMQKEDWEEVEKYYNLAEKNDPTNIEAIFYSSYAKARALMIESDHFKREHGFRVLCKCVSIVDENYKDSDIKVVEQISEDIISLTNSSFVYKGIDSDKLSDTYRSLCDVHCAWIISLYEIAKKATHVKEKTVIFRLLLEHYEHAKNIKSGDWNKVSHLASEAHGWLLENCEKYRTEYAEKQEQNRQREKAEQQKKKIIELQKSIKDDEKTITAYENDKKIFIIVLCCIPFLIGFSILCLSDDMLFLGVTTAIFSILLFLSFLILRKNQKAAYIQAKENLISKKKEIDELKNAP